ncbi:MAG: hypothetical protein ABI625_07510 [bacterium]
MLNKLARNAAVALALVVIAIPAAQAQTATQTVTFAVNAINQIAFVGAPSLTITTAVAGSAPTSVTDASSTWAVTCNQTGAKISAAIASNMPAGLTLSANLAAPTGGTSAGFASLSTVSVDLVTGITKLAQGSLGATYKLDATAAAGVVSSATRLVTYTISGGV